MSKESGRLTDFDPGREEQIYRCRDCFQTHLESELLYAPSPFDPDDTLTGCPNCRSCAEFDHLCDFDDCKRIVSGGHPTPSGGYAHRCWDHSPMNPAFQGATQ